LIAQFLANIAAGRGGSHNDDPFRSHQR